MDKPTVGRIVHYVAYGTPGGEFPVGVCRAAVITEVNPEPNPSGLVGLMVVNPTGLLFNRNPPYEPVGEGVTVRPGSWHWPERA